MPWLLRLKRATKDLAGSVKEVDLISCTQAKHFQYLVDDLAVFDGDRSRYQIERILGQEEARYTQREVLKRWYNLRLLVSSNLLWRGETERAC